MKTIHLTCHNCGANLEVEENVAFCSYCGTKLLIDDENRTTTHKFVRTYRDESKIRESERKELIRLKELEYEEKQRQREHKTQKWFWIGWAIFMAVCFLALFAIGKLDGSW